MFADPTMFASSGADPEDKNLMFEDKKPPSPSALDRAGAIRKAAASVNPAAAAATETLAQMLGHVFGSRRDDWLEALAARVEDLERERGITLEDLAKNQ